MASLYRVRTVWSGVAGSPYYTNTWFFGDVDTTPDAQEAVDGITDFLTAVAALIRTDILPIIDPEVVVIDSTNGDQTGIHVTAPATIDMTATGEVLPPYTQLLLRHGTGVTLSGKFLRGRTYLPGMVEASNTSSGQPGSTGTDIAAAWQANVGASGPNQVIFSPTYFGFGSVTSTTAWNQWAVLRSRRD